MNTKLIDSDELLPIDTVNSVVPRGDWHKRKSEVVISFSFIATARWRHPINSVYERTNNPDIYLTLAPNNSIQYAIGALYAKAFKLKLSLFELYRQSLKPI